MQDSVQSAPCRAQLCENSHKRPAPSLSRLAAAVVAAAVAVGTAAAVGAAWLPALHAQTAAPPVEHAAAGAKSAAQDHAAAAQPGAPAQPEAHAQPDAHGKPAAGAQAGAAHAQPAHGAEAAHGEEHHGESPLAFAARLANFVILVGALYYFLRQPVAAHLTSRDQQIRSDLVTAKETTATATAQLAEIDRKLQALPSEIATLKARGAEEIASEEARIRQAADAERQRLIEQTRRQIDVQVRLAKRALTEQAATLAVDLATAQVKQTMTTDDQGRLIDRYVTQVRKAPVD